MPIIVIRNIIGLLQGLLLATLCFMNQSPTPWWPATDLSVFIPMRMVILLIPLIIVLSIGNMRLKTALIWVLSATAIVWGISYYAVFREVPLLQNRIATFAHEGFVFFTGGALFIAQALILSSNSDNRLIAKYSTYFDIAWKLGVQVAFTATFILFFWMLLGLGMGLFEIINLSFFKKIITNEWFAIPATTLAITIALHITDVNVGIVRSIRTLILVLLSWLLPLTVTIISLFLVSLFYTGALFWQTAYPGTLLLLAAVALIILINAAYQDGKNTLAIIQRYSATVACCLLIPIITLAIYALYLRVQQYGWSVYRINAVVCMGVVAFYALGYTLAVFIPGRKLRLIEMCNIAAAWLIIAIYLALFTPVADPARFAVASQLLRLQTGQVSPEKFDFEALRFQGLRFGQQALEELQTSWQGPKADYVHAQAKAALALKIGEYRNVHKKNALTDETEKQLITVHTKDGKLPASFLNQSWNVMEGSIMIPDCLSNKSEICHAWIIKGNNKSDMILMLSGDGGFTGFQQNTQKIWKAIGYWYIPYRCKETRREAMSGKFKLVVTQPAQPDIEIMGWHTKFMPNDESDNTCK